MAIKLHKSHSKSDSFYELDDRILNDGKQAGEKAKSSSSEIFGKLTKFNKNILKSARNVAYDIDGAFVPNLKEFEESIKGTAKEAIDDLKNSLDQIKSFTNNNDGTPLTDKLKKSVSEESHNVLTRLKAGKLYMSDNERMEEQASAAFGDFGDDFSFGDDFGGFGDDTGTGGDTFVTEQEEDTLPDEPFAAPVHKGTVRRVNVSAKQRANKRKSKVKNPSSNNVAGKRSSGMLPMRVGEVRLGDELVSGTTSQVGQAIISQNQEIWAKNFAAAEIHNKKLITYQSNILKGVNALVEFNNNVFGENIRAQMEFQEKMIAAQEDTLSSLKELKDTLIATATYEPPTTDDARNEPLDAYGGINSSGYYKRIKENAIDMLGSTGLGSVLMMAPTLADSMKTAGEMGMKLTPDVLNVISKGLISSLLVSGKTRSKLAAANSMMNNAGALFTGKMNELAEYGNSGIARTIGKLLGTGGAKVKNIDMGLRDPNAVVGWTAKSDRTLNEVIPHYLAKMTSALTGGEESYYDYRSGTFKTTRTLKERYDQDIEEIFDDFSIKRYRDKVVANEISNREKNGDYIGLSDKEKAAAKKAEADKLDKAIKTITTNTIKSGKPFDPSLENNPDYREEILRGVDPDMADLAFDVLKRGYQSMNMVEQNAFNGAIGKVRGKAAKEIEDINNEYKVYGGGTHISEFAAEAEIAENQRVLGREVYYYKGPNGSDVIVGDVGSADGMSKADELRRQGIEVYEKVLGGDRKLRYDTANKQNARFLTVRSQRLGLKRQSHDLEYSTGKMPNGVAAGTVVEGYGDLGLSAGGNVSVPGTVNNIFKLLAQGIVVYGPKNPPEHIQKLRAALGVAQQTYAANKAQRDADYKAFTDMETEERRQLISDKFDRDFINSFGIGGYFDFLKYAKENKMEAGKIDKVMNAMADTRINLINTLFGTGGMHGEGIFTVDGVSEYSRVIKSQHALALKYAEEQIKKLEEKAIGTGPAAAFAKKMLDFTKKKYELIKKNITSAEANGNQDEEMSQFMKDLNSSISMVYRAYGIQNGETDTSDVSEKVKVGLYATGQKATRDAVLGGTRNYLKNRAWMFSDENNGDYRSYKFNQTTGKMEGVGQKAKTDEERSFNREFTLYKMWYLDANGKRKWIKSFNEFKKLQFTTEIHKVSRFGLDGEVTRGEANEQVKKTAREGLFELESTFKRFLNKIHATGEAAKFSNAIFNIAKFIGEGNHTLRSVLYKFRKDIKNSEFLEHVISGAFTDGTVKLTQKGRTAQLEQREILKLAKELIGRLSDAELKSSHFADDFEAEAIRIKDKVVRSGQGMFGKLGAKVKAKYDQMQDPDYDIRQDAIDTLNGIRSGVKTKGKAAWVMFAGKTKGIVESLQTVGLRKTLEIYKDEITQNPKLKEFITKLAKDPRVKPFADAADKAKGKLSKDYEIAKSRISEFAKSLKEVGYKATLEMYKDEIAQNPKIKDVIDKLMKIKFIRDTANAIDRANGKGASFFGKLKEKFKTLRNKGGDDTSADGTGSPKRHEFETFPELLGLLRSFGYTFPENEDPVKLESSISYLLYEDYNDLPAGMYDAIVHSNDWMRLTRLANRLNRTGGDRRFKWVKTTQNAIAKTIRFGRNLVTHARDFASDVGMQIGRLKKYGIHHIYPRIVSMLFSIGVDVSNEGENAMESDMKIMYQIELAALSNDPKVREVVEKIKATHDYAVLVKNISKYNPAEKSAADARKEKRKATAKAIINAIRHPKATAKKIGHTIADFVNDLRHAYPTIMKILAEHHLTNLMPTRAEYSSTKMWEKDLVVFIENLSAMTNRGDDPATAQKRIFASDDWLRLKKNSMGETVGQRFGRKVRTTFSKIKERITGFRDGVKEKVGNLKSRISNGLSGKFQDLKNGLGGWDEIAGNSMMNNAQYKGKYNIQKKAIGGIVSGPETGDKVPVMMNGGEMVLTKKHQSGLFGFLSGMLGGDTANGKIAQAAFTTAKKTDITGIIKGDTDRLAKRAILRGGPMSGMLTLLSSMNKTLASTLKVLGGNNLGEIEEGNSETIAGQINNIQLGGGGDGEGGDDGDGDNLLDKIPFNRYTLGTGIGIAALLAGGYGIGSHLKSAFSRAKAGGVADGITYGTGLSREGDSDLNADGSQKTTFQRISGRLGDQSGILAAAMPMAATQTARMATKASLFGNAMKDLGYGKGVFSQAKNFFGVVKDGFSSGFKNIGKVREDYKIAKGLAKDAAKAADGMGFKECMTKLFGKVLENKTVQRILGSGPMKAIKSAFSGMASKMTTMLAKSVKIAGKSIPFVSLIPAVLDVAIEIANGVSAAGRYFGVPASQVTAGMRATAALVKGIISLVTNIVVCFVPGIGAIVAEVVRACIPEKWLINTIYGIVSGPAGKEELAAKQKMMEDDAAKYGVNKDQLNEYANKTVGDHIGDFFRNLGSAITGKGWTGADRHDAEKLGMSYDAFKDFKTDYGETENDRKQDISYDKQMGKVNARKGDRLIDKIKNAKEAEAIFTKNHQQVEEEIKQAIESGDTKSIISLANRIKGGIKGQTNNVKYLDGRAKKLIDKMMDSDGMKASGITIRETKRSPLTQLAYFLRGRADDKTVDEVMKIAGFDSGLAFWGGDNSNYSTKTLKSNHLDGKAVDFNVNTPEQYAIVGQAAEEAGLEWGGNWPDLNDYPHVQLRAKNGGIVPGLRDMLQGDKVLARLNPKEMVLNDKQQYSLFQKIKSWENSLSKSGGVASLNESPMVTNTKIDMKDIEEAIAIQKAIYTEQKRHNAVAEEFFRAMISALGGMMGSKGNKTLMENEDTDITNLAKSASELASMFGGNRRIG